VLRTNTFGCLPATCGQAARLSLEAADYRAEVWGALGPAMMRSSRDTYLCYRACIHEFQKAGLRHVHFETMIHTQTLQVALQAALDAGMEASASCYVAATEPGYLTIKQFIHLCRQAGVEYVGLNCMPPDRRTASALRQLTASELFSGVCVYPCGAGLEPDRWSREVVEWLLPAGPTMIGGCCGTTPAHIAALARRLEALSF